MSRRITRSLSIYVSKEEMSNRRMTRSKSIYLSEPPKNSKCALEQSTQVTNIQNEAQVTNESFSPTFLSDEKSKTASLKRKYENSTPSRRSLRLISRNDLIETKETPKIPAKKISCRRSTIHYTGIKPKDIANLSARLNITCGMNMEKKESMISTPKNVKATSKSVNAADLVDPKEKTVKVTTKELFTTLSSTQVNEIQNVTQITNDSISTTSSTDVNHIQNETQVTHESFSSTFLSDEKNKTASLKYENPTLTRRSLRLISRNELNETIEISKIKATKISNRRCTVHSFGIKPKDIVNLPARLNITCGMNMEKGESMINTPKNVKAASKSVNATNPVDPKEKTVEVTTKKLFPTSSSTQVNEIQNVTQITNDSLSTTSSTQVNDTQNETQVNTNESCSPTFLSEEKSKTALLKRRYENSTPSRRSLRIISRHELNETKETPKIHAKKISSRRCTVHSFGIKPKDIVNLPARLNITCGMNMEKGESMINTPKNVKAASKSVNATNPVDPKEKTVEVTTKELFPNSSSTQVNEIQNVTQIANDSPSTTSSTQVNDIQNETQVNTNESFSPTFSSTVNEIQLEVTLSLTPDNNCETASLKPTFKKPTTPARRSLTSISINESHATKETPKIEATKSSRGQCTVHSSRIKPLNDIGNLPVSITSGMNTEKGKSVISTAVARIAAPTRRRAAPARRRAQKKITEADSISLNVVGPVNTARSAHRASVSNKNEPSILILPDDLKSLAFDDAKFIINEKKLNELHTDLNVAKVIDEYIATKFEELGTVHSSGVTAKQVLESLPVYFDALIGKQLLYNEECMQYEDMLQKFPGKAMSKIYPPIYLLRLLVRLNVLLPFSCRDADTLQWMAGHLNDLLNYLDENKFALFQLDSERVNLD